MKMPANESMHGGGMKQTFYFGYFHHLLFQNWNAETVTLLAVSCVGIFLASVLFEGLKKLRQNYQNRIASTTTTTTVEQSCCTCSPCICSPCLCAAEDEEFSQLTKTPVELKSYSSTKVSVQQQPTIRNPPIKKTAAMLGWDHFQLTLIHAIQFLFGYLLMLIVMSYNAWVTVAVIAGSTLGYFLIHWIRPTSNT